MPDILRNCRHYCKKADCALLQSSKRWKMQWASKKSLLGTSFSYTLAIINVEEPRQPTRLDKEKTTCQKCASPTTCAPRKDYGILEVFAFPGGISSRFRARTLEGLDLYIIVLYWPGNWSKRTGTSCFFPGGSVHNGGLSK